MSESALFSLLSSAGVAGFFCVFFLLGWIFPKSVVDDLKTERDYERKRADVERTRAEAAVAAAQGTRDIFAALQAGVTLGQRHGDVRSHGMHDDHRVIPVTGGDPVREVPVRTSDPGQERGPA